MEKHHRQRTSIILLMLTVLAGCNCVTCTNKSGAASSSAVAFVLRGNDARICTTQDFKNTVALTEGFLDSSPAWGPGKKEIFFDRSYEGSPEVRIWKMRWNGADQVAITPHGLHCEAPSLSPDGKHIAFMCEDRYSGGSLSRFDVCMVNPDGSNWTVLTDSAEFKPSIFAYFGRPTWSRDASKLGMYFHRIDQSNVFSFGILDLKTHDMTFFPQIDSLNGEDFQWSPTRDELVFLGYNLRVFRMNADGSGITELVGSYNNYVDWSPDGNEIIYDYQDSATVASSSEASFWVMNRDGTNKHVVMPYSGVWIAAPSWK
ncbi:MAG: hypothetical protein M1470_03390 [Bacteroidetes bacterium]|nr:hypothetical protein [Bacteroidota bacterium]MCL5737788.1 hypothetical protein [Bacteroidota bacterium]